MPSCLPKLGAEVMRIEGKREAVAVAVAVAVAGVGLTWH